MTKNKAGFKKYIFISLNKFYFEKPNIDYQIIKN